VVGRHCRTGIQGLPNVGWTRELQAVAAYENYTFTATSQGTKLTVDQDMTDDFESMPEAWPKALGKLKALCESR
jgi:hypothetical protein